MALSILKVLSPLNAAATSVTVAGALDGATVTVFADGASIGAPVIASGLTTAVPLGGTLLAAGAKVTATQSLAGQTSMPSASPVIVAAAPTASTGLPVPVFLSGLVPCMAWVLIGNAVPNAIVEIRRSGVLGGSAVASGPVVSVKVDFPQLPAAGDVLEAVLKFPNPDGSVLVGPAAVSLPVTGARQPLLPTPSMVAPFECDLAVLVSGLVDGSSLTVRHTADVVAGYPWVGNSVWAQLLKPVAPTDSFAVRQDYLHCGTESAWSSPPVTPNPAPELPTPVIVGPICPNAALLRLRALRPGATVTVYVARETAPGSESNTQIGQFRAWASDCDVELPPGWVGLQPGVGKLAVTAFQTNCGKGSKTVRHTVEPLPGSVGRPSAEPMVECARLIAANALTPGAVLEIVSDQADWPKLAGPVFIGASSLAVGLDRPLRGGELVTLRQTGCGVDASATIRVKSLDALPPPVVEDPVRIPWGGAWLRGLLVGARVHLFVRGKPAGSFDATAPRMFAPVHDIARETLITARQILCGKISDESNAVMATLGRMKVDHAPRPITRAKPTAITVTALDGDDGHVVAGRVFIGPAQVGVTGTTFGHTFGPGQPPASSVITEGYEFAPIDWELQDPPLAPQALLHLTMVNQSGGNFSLFSVTWSLARQNLDGTKTLIAQESGTSVAFTPPANGQYAVIAEVWAGDQNAGGTVLAEFRGGLPPVDGLRWHAVLWNGADLSATFRLFAETVRDGSASYVNPVVAP